MAASVECMDTVELQQLGAKPSVEGMERAIADFRAFVEVGDDSNMYLEPLREFLQAEGDIVGELAMTEEHLKKLKFNFIESYTKARFVSAVTNGQIDESAEQSAELDIQIANAKKQSKATQQRKEQAKNNIATSHAPAVAQRYAELDQKRISYQNELDWLQKQDKENIEAGRSIKPKSKEGCQKALEDQEVLIHKLRNDERKMTEKRAQLQADIAPLAEQSSALSTAVSALNRDAGRSELAAGFHNQEQCRWYTDVAAALSAQTGLELEIVSDGTAADKRKKLAVSVRSFYTPAPSDVTGKDDSMAMMDLDIPEDAEPKPRQATHMLTVTYNQTGTELAEVTVSPADVPTEDLVAHAIRTNNLRFLVRELRARVGNYYCRRDEISALQTSQSGAGSITVREESHGMVSMQLPNGLRCILSVGHDYPREHAVLRIVRWEDDARRTPADVMEQLKGSPPGSASDASLTDFCDALQERAQELKLM